MASTEESQRHTEIPWILQFLQTIHAPFLWTDAQENAFLGLQDTLTSSPVLLLPNYGKPFTLITDASDFAAGAILEQEDALGRSHPVAFFSKSLQLAERNYEIH